MKKLLLIAVITISVAACNNNADSLENQKDSIDSVADAKKEMIDSTAEQKKENVDSLSERKKETLERMDSLNRKANTKDTNRKK